MPNEQNSTLNLHFSEPYRQHIAGLNLSASQMDTMIEIVHAIVSHFVDQAFNVQIDQINVDAAARLSNEQRGHVTIEHYPENHTASFRCDDAESDSNPTGPREP